MSDTEELHDEFNLLHVLARESAAIRQRMISYLQFYMSVQIAMGGLFGVILVSLPEALDELTDLMIAYICGTGLLMSLGVFAYGTIWLFPKRRKEDWITEGLSQIGNTHDLAAWNRILIEHISLIETANHNLRKHLSRVRNLVLVELVFLVTGFLGAFVFWN
jgi:hypothetical protein